jgi:hypothetical protein
MNRKPFPSKVNWRALWRHRWVLLNFLNQVAYGRFEDTCLIVGHYSGTNSFARLLYKAATDVIQVESKPNFRPVRKSISPRRVR